MESKYSSTEINGEIQSVYENDVYNFRISTYDQDLEIKTSQSHAIIDQLVEDLTRTTIKLEKLVGVFKGMVEKGTMAQSGMDEILRFIYNSQNESSKRL